MTPTDHKAAFMLRRYEDAVREFLQAIDEQIAKHHDLGIPVTKLQAQLYNATCKAALEVCKKGMLRALKDHGIELDGEQ